MLSTERSKKAKRICSIIAIAMSLCLVTTITVSAKSFTNFCWMQSTGPYYVSLGQMSPGPNQNTNGIKFHCVSYSAQSGTFKIVLQRQNALGIWVTVGQVTGSQCSQIKYDPLYTNYVAGQPNECAWATNQSGNYRIVLENPTNPQATDFQRIQAWTY